MSEGKLCGCKLMVSTEMNKENSIELSCDGWHGHTGDHTATIYHTQKDGNVTHNKRIGVLRWSQENPENKPAL